MGQMLPSSLESKSSALLLQHSSRGSHRDNLGEKPEYTWSANQAILQFSHKRRKKVLAFRYTAFRNTLVVGLESLEGCCWQSMLRANWSTIANLYKTFLLKNPSSYQLEVVTKPKNCSYRRHNLSAKTIYILIWCVAQIRIFYKLRKNSLARFYTRKPKSNLPSLKLLVIVGKRKNSIFSWLYTMLLLSCSPAQPWNNLVPVATSKSVLCPAIKFFTCYELALKVF